AGGFTQARSAGGIAGNGGNATSSATAIAFGDSSIQAHSNAAGGNAGGVFSVPYLGYFGDGGNGGTATSQASAIGTGISPLSATANATGGSGIYGYGIGGNGGNGGVGTATA